MAKQKNFSVYLSYLLRHSPQSIGLAMDRHGWVEVAELIGKVNAAGEYTVTPEQLRQVVAEDNKGRYRFTPDGSRIKACQGHSIEWVEPELTYGDTPQYLYHGTTADAYSKILSSGGIRRMSRHAVHMTADPEKAWQSARRWHRSAVVLKIDARRLEKAGIAIGCSDNAVWCAGEVPVECICDVLYE